MASPLTSDQSKIHDAGGRLHANHLNSKPSHKQQKRAYSQPHIAYSSAPHSLSLSDCILFGLVAHLCAAHLFKRLDPRRPLLVAHRQELPVPMRRVQLNAIPLLVRLRPALVHQLRQSLHLESRNGVLLLLIVVIAHHSIVLQHKPPALPRLHHLTLLHHITLLRYLALLLGTLRGSTIGLCLELVSVLPM